MRLTPAILDLRGRAYLVVRGATSASFYAPLSRLGAPLIRERCAEAVSAP
jgi:hypothetical protein